MKRNTIAILVGAGCFSVFAASCIVTGMICLSIVRSVPPTLQAAAAGPALLTDRVRSAGHMAVQHPISQTLNGPTSASFPWETVTAESLKPVIDPSGASVQRWRVSGAVDAQNSLGVITRAQWEVSVLYTNGRFVTSAAALEGKPLRGGEGRALPEVGDVRPPAPQAVSK